MSVLPEFAMALLKASKGTKFPWGLKNGKINYCGPKENAPQEKDIEKIFKSDLLNLIDRSCAQQIYFFETIADSVHLASEAVQDCRLKMLEDGPEVTGSQIFMDLLMTFALSSVSVGLGVVVTSVLKTRMLSAPRMVLTPSEIIRQDYLNQMKKIGGKNFKEFKIRDLITPGNELYDHFHAKFMENAINVPFDVLIDRVRDASVKETGIPKSSPDTYSVCPDSPGVKILDIVQQFARYQTYAVRYQHNFDKNNVLLDLLTLEEKLALCNFYYDLLYDKDGNSKMLTQTNISQIKKDYRLLFEAYIWVEIIKGSFGSVDKLYITKIMELPIPGLLPPSPPKEFRAFDIAGSIVDYWLKRFKKKNQDELYKYFKDIEKRGSDDQKAIKKIGLFVIKPMKLKGWKIF